MFLKKINYEFKQKRIKRTIENTRDNYEEEKLNLEEKLENDYIALAKANEGFGDCLKEISKVIIDIKENETKQNVLKEIEDRLNKEIVIEDKDSEESDNK